MHYKILDIKDEKNGNCSVLIKNPFGPGTTSYGFTYEEMKDEEKWKAVIENHLIEQEEKRVKAAPDIEALKAKHANKTHEAKKHDL